MYYDDDLARFVREGANVNCGSNDVCDSIILQAPSEKNHYNKFVVEAKFQESPAKYDPAIKAHCVLHEEWRCRWHLPTVSNDLLVIS